MQRFERLLMQIMPSYTPNAIDATSVDTLFSYIAFVEHEQRNEGKNVVDNKGYMIINGKRYKKTTIDKMSTYGGA